METSGTQCGVDIPSTNPMVLVCANSTCFGTNWVQMPGSATIRRASGMVVLPEWCCGDCGHKQALLTSTDGLARMKAVHEGENP